MKKLLKRILTKLLSPLQPKFQQLEKQIEQNRMLTAQILIGDLHQRGKLSRLQEAEFKVFSQWGEDGIIQYLISRVPVDNKIFVEFGVENYSESNTRFLLMNNDWKGLVIDGNADFINSIKTSDIYWRHNITAVNAFITKDNINDLIGSNGITGEIGILSIDIDGNDYWVWQAINVIYPRIVICEYNSIFGCNFAVTVPYNEHFNRTSAHHSNLYFGASLKALCMLAEKKGYVFAGSNTAGSNAFFVKKDHSSGISALDYRTGYVKSKARESRDENGRLTFVSGDERIKLIEDLNVIDVETNSTRSIKELLR